MFRHGVIVTLFSFVTALAAPAPPPVTDAAPTSTDGAASDPAAAFGARQGIVDLSLAPDGRSVAYIRATAGQSSALYTLDLGEGGKARVALLASGKPERLTDCHWVSNSRLVCTIYGVVRSGIGLLPFTRLVAVDHNGGNVKVLSTTQNEYSHDLQLGGGRVLDWLPDEDGAVLMSRHYVPDEHLGTRVGSSLEGMGVDHLDTRTLQVTPVERPSMTAVAYLSDGRGNIRVVGRSDRGASGYTTGIVRYFYRKQESREWSKLSESNSEDRSGFQPLAVDHDLDIVYGLQRKDGRTALYSLSLDGSLTAKLILARPDVDVEGLVRIGRRDRVVGVSYATDSNHAVYFDPDVEQIMRSLSRALPHQPQVSIVDSSVDERTLLVFAGSDDDPGVYYVFDRNSKQLHTFLVVRPELEGVKLAKVKFVKYPATDGEMIPAYLTLPPGVADPKGLPAIVLPHGGPSARDYWGFDWLSQFYASRGYAVLQPNFRGSAGYGDAWLKEQGFRSWRIAIGDVTDAGRWLISQGIADPTKLCIVGWSYGGYAALQSAVAEPGLFKAVVAIAPVTDLATLKEEHRNWSDFRLVSAMVGEGAQLQEASPARNAKKIRVPVLLFHGAEDTNVAIAQSRSMAHSLESAGVKSEFVSWDDLDHNLDDSAARTHMLRKSDEFLRSAIGVTR